MRVARLSCSKKRKTKKKKKKKEKEKKKEKKKEKTKKTTNMMGLFSMHTESKQFLYLA